MRTRIRHAVAAVQVVAVLAAVGVAGAASGWSDWDPGLIAILLGLSILGELFPIEARTFRISGSFPALVLAMAVLGPGPAVVIGLATTLAIDVFRSTLARRRFLTNVSAYAVFPLAGAMAFHVLGMTGAERGSALGFGALVFAAFLAVNFLNFVLIVYPVSVIDGFRFRPKLRLLYLPVVPVQAATALLTATVAFGYAEIGLTAIAISGIVGLVFVYLVRVNIKANERGEQLELRTRQLASLQVGLLTTVVKTLSLRDKMTARHSAAVARYARETANALGMSEQEQDLVHTAALLHDIGKFVFPDSILFANSRLSEEELEIVRSHPERGAELVASIEGYGPVADIILAHHERIDGAGYPNGLRGEAIPLAARIISVCDTYDVMTARDSYRRPVSREEAFAELRRVSGSQLDAAVVEAFIDLVERNSVAFRHADNADFEAELQLDRRIRDHARPQVLAA